MAARTVITPVQLVQDGTVVAGAGTAGALTMTVPAPGPYKVLLQVTNAAVTGTNVTLRARGNGVDASGNAQTTGYQPMAAASSGDDVFAVAASTTRFIGPLTGGRFQQADSSLSIDLSAITSVTVWAIQLPYQP